MVFWHKSERCGDGTAAILAYRFPQGGQVEGFGLS
jgi:hypothetical protein